MAVINSQIMSGADWEIKAMTVLGTSDTLTFDPSKKQILVIVNETGGNLTPNIVGSSPSATYPVQNAKPVDLSAGLTSGTIPDGSAGLCYLNNNAAYLAGDGTVTVTDALAATAILIELN